ncbi:putative membrane protein [Candidatus Ichthyocystis hellenicum]|uniref:Putative membrane protein n=1 Tax=Candidatus Ichthyocystis hellenicum TaxID=1561003 RepID=A0A0S4M410_9BURK|nr:putative membrane protein [Candidatus Ichthyocystis hellenicum]
MLLVMCLGPDSWMTKFKGRQLKISVIIMGFINGSMDCFVSYYI